MEQVLRKNTLNSWNFIQNSIPHFIGPAKNNFTGSSSIPIPADRKKSLRHKKTKETFFQLIYSF
jgi:hypothetical protein